MVARDTPTTNTISHLALHSLHGGQDQLIRAGLHEGRASTVTHTQNSIRGPASKWIEASASVNPLLKNTEKQTAHCNSSVLTALSHVSVLSTSSAGYLVFPACFVFPHTSWLFPIYL